ncbi:hypothetical protein PFISCL1PPCAC_27546, partial [Pristionchus fissidentatus]
VRLVTTLGPWPCHDLVLTTSDKRQVYTYKDSSLSRVQIPNTHSRSKHFYTLAQISKSLSQAIKMAVDFISGNPIELKIFKKIH